MLAAAVAAQQKIDKQDAVSRTRLGARTEQLAASEQANAEMLGKNNAATAAAQPKLEKQHEVSAIQLAGLTEQLAAVKAKAVNAAVAIRVTVGFWNRRRRFTTNSTERAANQ